MMAPWRKQGRPGYVMRVYAADGECATCSCGTTLKTVARDIAEWVETLQQSPNARSAEVLQAIVTKRIQLKDAYTLGVKETLDRLREMEAGWLDIDLLSMLREWGEIKAKASRGGASASRYLVQIRVLFPETPLSRSLLTAPQVAIRLDTLNVPSDATRNRYRAALSSWCKWLVRRGVLEINPARAAGGYSEPIKPIRFRSMEQAQLVIERLADVEDRAREALMAGAGLDWSDTARLRRRDIALDGVPLPTVRCDGSKTPWRNRVVHITQPWTAQFIRPHLANKHTDATLFFWGHRAALSRHYEACNAANVARFKLHEWRDTYAVAELQAGERPEIVAHQLGHKDASLVWKRYGRYIPQAQDYRSQRAADAVILTATQTATHQKTRR